MGIFRLLVVLSVLLVSITSWADTFLYRVTNPHYCQGASFADCKSPNLYLLGTAHVKLPEGSFPGSVQQILDLPMEGLFVEAAQGHKYMWVNQIGNARFRTFFYKNTKYSATDKITRVQFMRALQKLDQKIKKNPHVYSAQSLVEYILKPYFSNKKQYEYYCDLLVDTLGEGCNSTRMAAYNYVSLISHTMSVLAKAYENQLQPQSQSDKNDQSIFDNQVESKFREHHASAPIYSLDRYYTFPDKENGFQELIRFFEGIKQSGKLAYGQHFYQEKQKCMQEILVGDSNTTAETIEKMQADDPVSFVYQEIYVKRNTYWNREYFRPLLEGKKGNDHWNWKDQNKNYLAAVGAGHFATNFGLLKIFEAQGYTVEPIHWQVEE